jgi:hypothetical protein
MMRRASENSINLSITSPDNLRIFGVEEIICAVITGIKRFSTGSKDDFV